jgi:hypothetical protein
MLSRPASSLGRSQGSPQLRMSPWSRHRESRGALTCFVALELYRRRHIRVCTHPPTPTLDAPPMPRQTNTPFQPTQPINQPTLLNRQVLEVCVKDSHMTGRTNLGKASYPLK